MSSIYILSKYTCMHCLLSLVEALICLHKRICLTKRFSSLTLTSSSFLRDLLFFFEQVLLQYQENRLPHYARHHLCLFSFLSAYQESSLCPAFASLIKLYWKVSEVRWRFLTSSNPLYVWQAWHLCSNQYLSNTSILPLFLPVQGAWNLQVPENLGCQQCGQILQKIILADIAMSFRGR